MMCGEATPTRCTVLGSRKGCTPLKLLDSSTNCPSFPTFSAHGCFCFFALHAPLCVCGIRPGHDEAIWTTLEADAAHARQIAALPGALGGLSLRSAETTAPAAYWAFWAGALPAIRARLMRCAANYVQPLEAGDGTRLLCLISFHIFT